jgi:hypothetical protein
VGAGLVGVAGGCVSVGIGIALGSGVALGGGEVGIADGAATVSTICGVVDLPLHPASKTQKTKTRQATCKQAFMATPLPGGTVVTLLCHIFVPLSPVNIKKKAGSPLQVAANLFFACC